ncbi:hypothetical protein EIP86_004490 [Pleurotus ostreatoroseus]|nr:hypothetical protein EIP86_004490 [Pleurotus ostreatoroseus]
MATPYAFVTLVTSDSYLPGALALVAALDELHPSPPISPEVGFQTVCLVTPETVDVSTIKLLRRAFNVVVGVEIIEQEDDKNLRLLGRPDLNTVLTKLHIFRLTQYSKIIFLDADVLPIRPLSHLFTLPHEFSAVPDVGWPDIFNSGVLVASPGEDKFNELMELQKTKGSWDGGDQGLLNEWRGQNWHRLSFLYNTTPTAAYTYAPAYERFGSGITAIHFIGENKPWRSLPWRSPGTKSSQVTMENGAKRAYDYDSLVDRWYDIYDRHYRVEAPAPNREFEVQRYTSVWDEGSSVGAETQTTGAAPPGPGVAMGLDELRTVAVQGLAALGHTQPQTARPTEGEYRSLPLEGRIDLMRPQKAAEQESEHAQEAPSDERPRDDRSGSPDTPRPSHVQMPQDDQGYFRTDAYPTPGPNEVPPAPYLHGHSLPPTQTPTPYWAHPSEQHSQGYQESHEEPHWQSSQEPYREHHDASHGQRQEECPKHNNHIIHMPLPQDPSIIVTDPTRTKTRLRSRHLEQKDLTTGRIHKEATIRPVAVRKAASRSVGTSRLTSMIVGLAKEAIMTAVIRKIGDGRNIGLRRLNGIRRSRHNTEVLGIIDNTEDMLMSIGLLVKSTVLPHNHHNNTLVIPPPRPISPPKVEWNPAKEPPPKTPPPIFAFPEDTYFPNVWDQTPSQQHDATYQSYTSPERTTRPDAFFHPPPPAHIPEQLIREGQYANVIGQTPPPPQDSPESVVTSPTPDRKNVHAVFPWEEKPRHRPRRVFPRSDSPPPAANYIESERTSSPVATPPPTERPPPVHSPTSPTGQWGLGFSNAWDTVPAIQRYASKLAGPSIFTQMMQSPPPPPPEDGWRRWEKQRERDWQERQDASSMDGDDEDDEEDEEFEEGGVQSETSTKSRASASSRVRSRALSGRSRKRYRTRGVQASPETVDEGVQCTIDEKGTDLVEHVSIAVGTEPPITKDGPCPCCGRTCSPENCVSSRTDTGARARARSSSGSGFGSRRWGPVPGLLPSAVPRDLRLEVEPAVGTPIATNNVRSGMPFPSMATPSGLRSPATLGSPRTYSPPQVKSPPAVMSPPRVPTPKALSPLQATSPVKVPSPLGSPHRVLSPPLTQPGMTQTIHSPRPSASPRQVMSPRRTSISSVQTSRTTSPVVGTGARAQQQQNTPSPKLTRLSPLTAIQSPALQRSISAETATTPSPSSTHDSLITPEGTPILPRKSGRVWDPARGVDVFKRGSEEVLARFLRMGSFDEEEGKRQAV